MSRLFDRFLPCTRMAAGFALLLAGCKDVDYDFGRRGPAPQVTVNALLTPQEDFVVSLHWSGTYAKEKMTFEPVAQAEIRLLEEGREVVRCAASADGRTSTGFRPVAGRSYRLEVTVPDYGRLTAETSVPEAPRARIREMRSRGWYRHFTLEELTLPPDVRSVWIRGFYRQTDPESGSVQREVGDYYTTSPFVDQVNGANDADEADEKGSTIIFDEFLRIPYENRTRVLPLYFSVWGTSDDRTRIRHTFRFITPSDTYDRYMRSRYKQQLNTTESAEENPFIEQITVYTNISNGLGVFAGYNYFQISEL